MGWGAVSLIALMLFFAIYTATKFPYTYITMEGNDFWVLTKGFWQLKLATLPAVTCWIADWLMQFFSSPYVAASIVALLLGAIGLLAKQVLKPFGAWSWLGLLLPILLGYFCTFSLSFQLQCLFFLALLLTYRLIPNFWGKLVWSVLCATAGFFLLRTPMLFLLLLFQAAIAFKSLGWKKSVYMVLPLILLALMPLAYSQQVAFIPFEERYTAWGVRIVPLTGRYNQDMEYIDKCVCLSNEERWEELLYKEHISRDAQRGKPLALRYALLAESALGTLPDNIGLYPIQNENQFLYQHETDLIASQFNRLFYLNLGIYDEAYHQAQEYGLLQPNGICFSSLRQMVEYSIKEGDFETAEKFQRVLSKSTSPLPAPPLGECLGSEKGCSLDTPPKGEQEGAGRSLRADNFVGGYPLPVEMLRLALYYNDKAAETGTPNPNIKKMLDYALCSYLLRGDMNSFVVALKAFDIYKDKELPKAYQMLR